MKNKLTNQLIICTKSKLYQLYSVNMNDPFELNCALIHTLDILGKKWNPFIIAELMMSNKPLTFTDLQEALHGNYGSNISARVLTDKLNRLIKFDIVSRTETRAGNVFYTLTERGLDFRIVFASLKSWGTKHGDVRYDDCRNQTCLHKTVEFFDFEEFVRKLEIK